MKNKFLVLMTICIAINLSLGQLASMVKLPIFLDSIGTILSAILLGPWGGMLTGLCTNLIWALFKGRTAAAFAPVAMIIGLTAGLLSRKGMFDSITKTIVTGIVITLCLTVVATPIRTYLFAGVTGSGADFIVAYIDAVGQKLLESVAITVIGVNLVDKILSCLIARSLILGLPERVKVHFPRLSQAFSKK